MSKAREIIRLFRAFETKRLRTLAKWENLITKVAQQIARREGIKLDLDFIKDWRSYASINWYGKPNEGEITIATLRIVQFRDSKGEIEPSRKPNEPMLWLDRKLGKKVGTATGDYESDLAELMAYQLLHEFAHLKQDGELYPLVKSQTVTDSETTKKVKLIREIIKGKKVDQKEIDKLFHDKMFYKWFGYMINKYWKFTVEALT
jgi:hypothetical protein